MKTKYKLCASVAYHNCGYFRHHKYKVEADQDFLIKCFTIGDETSLNFYEALYADMLAEHETDYPTRWDALTVSRTISPHEEFNPSCHPTIGQIHDHLKALKAKNISEAKKKKTKPVKPPTTDKTTTDEPNPVKTFTKDEIAEFSKKYFNKTTT